MSEFMNELIDYQGKDQGRQMAQWQSDAWYLKVSEPLFDLVLMDLQGVEDLAKQASELPH